MKTKIGKMSRDRMGRTGARVSVELDRETHGVSGSYHFATHGLSVEQVTAKRNDLVARHKKLAARFLAFEAIRGMRTGGFTVTACTLNPRGTNVELFVRLASDDDRIDIVRVYADVDAVPKNVEIQSLIRDVATQRANASKVNENHMKIVRQALGVGGE